MKIKEQEHMEELQDRYIRFDWAIKRLLRQKVNFVVLERFLTVFIGEKITITEILESEGNQQSKDDKFNRMDIKALNSKGEIIIIEIQNTRKLYYLERIFYGVAKAITGHIYWGDRYYKVKKGLFHQYPLFRHWQGKRLPLSRPKSICRCTYQGLFAGKHEGERDDRFTIAFRYFP